MFRHAEKRHRSHTEHRQQDLLIPSVDQRIVQKGDTLWDLCGEVTGKPWLWPRVWSMNPAVTNPHWIYPGMTIHFVPQSPRHLRDAVSVASNVDLPSANEIAPSLESNPAPKIEVISDKSKKTADKSSLTERIFKNTFVTRRRLEESGTLTNATPDRILLRPGDDLFITYPKDKIPSVGDKFYIYRTRDQIQHPRTGMLWGYVTEITGLAAVISLNNNVAKARLTHAVLEIERGQRVMPYREDFRTATTPNNHAVDVTGMVMGIQERRASAGEQSFVFIDKGTEDGLEVGNRLSVQSHGDPVNFSQDKILDTDFATLLVVDTHDSSATCLVIDSLHEIWPGDTFHAAVPSAE